MAYIVRWWFDNSAKTKKWHDLPQGCSAKKVQASRSEKKKTFYYSGRVGKKAEMMRQFYKAKLFIEKEADERMVQEEVAPFEPKWITLLMLLQSKMRPRKI